MRVAKLTLACQQSKNPRTHIDLFIPNVAVVRLGNTLQNYTKIVYIAVPLCIIGWLDSDLYVNL